MPVPGPAGEIDDTGIAPTPLTPPWPSGTVQVYGMSERRNWHGKAKWLKVKAAYQRGEGSCAELARRFGLKLNSVSTRCRREGWRRELELLEQRMNKKVEESLTARALSLADRAESFTRRTVDEAEGWMDAIQEAKRLADAGDVQALKDLVNAWRIPVQEARRAYGLDRADSSPQVQVQVLQSSVQVIGGEGE